MFYKLLGFLRRFIYSVLIGYGGFGDAIYKSVLIDYIGFSDALYGVFS